MVDSSMVLNGQTIAYTCYTVAIMLLVGWFAIKLTRSGKGTKVKPALFYSFVGLLVVLGVSLHIITYNTIPWTPIDLHRSHYTADRTFDITVKNHQFILPEDQLVVKTKIVMSLGIQGVIGIFTPSKLKTRDLVSEPG